MKISLTLFLAICCCANGVTVFADQNNWILTDTEGAHLSFPVTSLSTSQERKNALDSLLVIIQFLTGADFNKILTQLQSSIEGSLSVLQNTVKEVETMFSNAGLYEVIKENVPVIVGQAVLSASQAVANMLELLLWILNTSGIPTPLQAVVIVIAVVNASIPAFLQALVITSLDITENQVPEVLDRLPLIFDEFTEELQHQVEPLLELLRPIIPGLP